MNIYRFLGNVKFPRSYVGKFLVICFAGTHAPLIAFAVYALAALPLDRQVATLAVLIIGATLAGTAMTLLLIHGLLSPIVAAQRALKAYIGAGVRPSLPTDGKDEAGLLLAQIQFVVTHLDDALADSERQAMTDDLTGVGNRRWFSKEADRAFARHRRTRAPLAAIILDIDHFKSVNDRYGHAAGDEVLKQVADAIRIQLRPDDLFARTGGEEFCVLLPDIERVQAKDVAERLRASIARLRFGSEGAWSVTASFGIAETDAAHATFSRLFTAADRRLYEAKNGGRNRVCAESAPEEIRTAAA